MWIFRAKKGMAYVQSVAYLILVLIAIASRRTVHCQRHIRASWLDDILGDILKSKNSNHSTTGTINSINTITSTSSTQSTTVPIENIDMSQIDNILGKLLNINTSSTHPSIVASTIQTLPRDQSQQINSSQIEDILGNILSRSDSPPEGSALTDLSFSTKSVNHTTRNQTSPNVLSQQMNNSLVNDILGGILSRSNSPTEASRLSDDLELWNRSTPAQTHQSPTTDQGQRQLMNSSHIDKILSGILSQYDTPPKGAALNDLSVSLTGNTQQTTISSTGTSAHRLMNQSEVDSLLGDLWKGDKWKASQQQVNDSNANSPNITSQITTSTSLPSHSKGLMSYSQLDDILSGIWKTKSTRLPEVNTSTKTTSSPTSTTRHAINGAHVNSILDLLFKTSTRSQQRDLHESTRKSTWKSSPMTLTRSMVMSTVANTRRGEALVQTVNDQTQAPLPSVLHNDTMSKYLPKSATNSRIGVTSGITNATYLTLISNASSNSQTRSSRSISLPLSTNSGPTKSPTFTTTDVNSILDGILSRLTQIPPTGQALHDSNGTFNTFRLGSDSGSGGVGGVGIAGGNGSATVNTHNTTLPPSSYYTSERNGPSRTISLSPSNYTGGNHGQPSTTIQRSTNYTSQTESQRPTVSSSSVNYTRGTYDQSQTSTPLSSNASDSLLGSVQDFRQNNTDAILDNILNRNNKTINNLHTTGKPFSLNETHDIFGGLFSSRPKSTLSSITTPGDQGTRNATVNETTPAPISATTVPTIIGPVTSSAQPFNTREADDIIGDLLKSTTTTRPFFTTPTSQRLSEISTTRMVITQPGTPAATQFRPNETVNILDGLFRTTTQKSILAFTTLPTFTTTPRRGFTSSMSESTSRHAVRTSTEIPKTTDHSLPTSIGFMKTTGQSLKSSTNSAMIRASGTSIHSR